MTAATAPVAAATSNAEAAARQQASGLTNPDQLYENVASSGQQATGTAADQAVMDSLSSLQGLTGGQEGLLGTGGTELANAGQQYGGIAQQLDPWNAIAAIIQAGAEAYGASQGVPSRGGTPSTPSTPSTPTVQPAAPVNVASSISPALVALARLGGYGGGSSAPTSQIGGGGAQQNPYLGFLGAA